MVILLLLMIIIKTIIIITAEQVLKPRILGNKLTPKDNANSGVQFITPAGKNPDQPTTPISLRRTQNRGRVNKTTQTELAD